MIGGNYNLFISRNDHRNTNIIGAISVLVILILGTNNNSLESTLSSIGIMLPTFFILISLNSSFSKYLLGCAPLRFLGKRAYSIYLIHWPIIVFTHYRYGQIDDSLYSILLVLASMLSGIVLYESVESKFRFKSTTSEESQGTILWITGLICSIFIFFSSELSTTTEKLFKHESSILINEIIAKTNSEKQLQSNLSRWQKCSFANGTNFDLSFQDECLKPVPNKVNIVVIGDSFADDTFIGLNAILDSSQYNILQATMHGCFPIDYTKSGDIKNCIDYHNYRMKKIKEMNYDAVVLAGAYSDLNGQAPSLVAPLVQTLKNHSTRIYVIGYRPGFTEFVPRILQRTNSIRLLNNQLREYSRIPLNKLQALNEEFKHAINDVGGTYIDVLSVLCNNKQCPGILNKNLLYHDNRHLTLNGGKVLAQTIVSQMNIDKD